MLITVSGMVGSGKSTASAIVAEVLAKDDLPPRQLRFRYLKLFGFNRPKQHGASGQRTEAATARIVRGKGFTPRRLTALLTIGYAVRILAFRFSSVGAASRCDILDRYFYDNLAHYDLTPRRARLFAHALRRLIPVPDLAILLVASDETISMRRPEYAPHYVAMVGRGYRALPELFPHLVTIDTDPGKSGNEDIRRVARILRNRDRMSER